jgi:hypothetical protein
LPFRVGWQLSLYFAALSSTAARLDIAVAVKPYKSSTLNFEAGDYLLLSPSQASTVGMLLGVRHEGSFLLQEYDDLLDTSTSQTKELSMNFF